MNLITYYEHYNRNVGRIKSINDKIIASINPGHGGGDIILPLNCCYAKSEINRKQNYYHQVEPNVNDRVLLCINDTGETVLLLI